MYDITHETQTTMTQELRVALRHADTLCFDFDSGLATIRLIKRIRSDDPFDEGRSRTIRFPGFASRIGRGRRDGVYEVDDYVAYSSEESNEYTPMTGCWIVTTCRHDADVMTAFAATPNGAELTFVVALDALSNAYCARARLHGDVLRMTAKKGKTLRTFTLDASVCAHNSARFGNRL